MVTVARFAEAVITRLVFPSRGGRGVGEKPPAHSGSPITRQRGSKNGGRGTKSVPLSSSFPSAGAVGWAQTGPAWVPAPAGNRFLLDREVAQSVIAEVWGVSPALPSTWRLDAFGQGLGSSLENLGEAVFVPGRGLVPGPLEWRVRVFPLADAHAAPLLVCIARAEFPMSCTGVEDVSELLGDVWGEASPDFVLDSLQKLLDVASGVVAAHHHQPLG
jgi:hypothetical protein